MGILAVIVAAMVVGSLVLSMVFLWLGALLVRAPKASVGRALAATMILTAIGIFFVPASLWVRQEYSKGGDRSFQVGAEIMLGLLVLLASWVVIMRLFDTTLPRAVGIWLLNLAATIVVGLVFYLPVKMFVMDAYEVPANGMAPTILGWHHETSCPRCQGTLILSAPDPNNPIAPPVDDDRPGICVSCRKTSTKAVPPDVHPPDRILVSKLHQPARWDVIVFRYPKEPAQKYVKRLVGFPGEKVYIKEDSLWINDVKRDLPANLAGLEYTTDLGAIPDLMATEENPLRLGASEYCVFGDFSKNASDSRVWGPVPEANIEGVVTLCYWPMSRWNLFR